MADLERTLQSTNQNLKNPPLRANEGEATLYGVYYDDTEYDYMQHLRGLEVDDPNGMGASAGPDEAIFVPAPGRGSTAVGNRGAAGRTTVARSGKEDDFAQGFFKKGQSTPLNPASSSSGSVAGSSILPSTVLPSTTERSYQQAIEATRAIPSQLSGFRPDMDPHLRQVLEALEDDAFVESDDEDVEVEVFDMKNMNAKKAGKGKKDWFDELLTGGERGEDEPDLEEEFEFREEGIEDDGRPSWVDPALRPKRSAGDIQEEGEDEGAEGETWEDRFRAFKASGGLARPTSPPVNPQADEEDETDDLVSEKADTLASLRSFAPTVNGAKNRRRKGSSRAGGSQASGYSMSSSSMFRNKGLSVLDERFDKVSNERGVTMKQAFRTGS